MDKVGTLWFGDPKVRSTERLNSNKGTKSDIEIAPAKRFEAVVQIGSGGVVVTGDKLLAGAISQQALDLRTMEAAPASRSPTAR